MFSVSLVWHLVKFFLIVYLQKELLLFNLSFGETFFKTLFLNKISVTYTIYSIPTERLANSKYVGSTMKQTAFGNNYKKIIWDKCLMLY